jgi:hypothetical protein
VLRNLFSSLKRKASPEQIESLLAQAKERRKAGEPRAAIALYREALEAGAPPADTHLQLGVLHQSLAENEQAITELRRAIHIAPENPDPLCVLGTVMLDLRRVDEAISLFERSLELKPDLAESHFNLGLARFERGEFIRAAASFSRCQALNRGEPWDAARRADLSRDPAPSFEPKDMGVNRMKLRHDCEQLDYLLSLGRLPASYAAVLADYRALLAEVAHVDVDMLVAFDAARHPLVARTYKRPVHIVEGAAPHGPVINPELDFRAIESRYLNAEPNAIAVDSLLTPQALAEVRRFCFESTFWNNLKAGYLGAYFYDGFFSPLLLQLAYELRESFPAIFRGHPLQMMWGFKCEYGLQALGVHADNAAVNVNFWITDDSANLEPAGGGLLIYPQAAPQEWGFAKYNHDPGFLLRYLESTGQQPIRVPYGTNRAVVFDSDLFHASDRPNFRDGYLNRRINITLLYGLRTA